MTDTEISLLIEAVKWWRAWEWDHCDVPTNISQAIDLMAEKHGLKTTGTERQSIISAITAQSRISMKD